MNVYKWQLFVVSFFVQLFQDHMYHFFVSGVTFFFSNIQSFYEILFLIFFFSTCSQSYKNNENARNKEIVFDLFNVTDKNSTITQYSNTSDIHKTWYTDLHWCYPSGK